MDPLCFCSFNFWVQVLSHFDISVSTTLRSVFPLQIILTLISDYTIFKVHRRLTKLRISMHFWSPIRKSVISWCWIICTFSDWLSMWPKLSSSAMKSPPHIIHQGPHVINQQQYRQYSTAVLPSSMLCTVLTLNTFSLFTWPKPWNVDWRLFNAYNICNITHLTTLYNLTTLFIHNTMYISPHLPL